MAPAESRTQAPAAALADSTKGGRHALRAPRVSNRSQNGFWPAAAHRGQIAKAQPARNAANLAGLLGWYVEGRLKPHVSGTYPLASYGEALEAVVNRRVLGKAVLVMD